MVNQTSEVIIESPPITTDNQDQVNLHDAMYKVTNHEDVSFTEPNNWLKFRDCMDLVTGRVSELVESVNLSNLAILDQIKTPPCRVELVWIKFTPTVKLPTLQTTQDLLALGDYFTRSKTKPKNTGELDDWGVQVQTLTTRKSHPPVTLIKNRNQSRPGLHRLLMVPLPHEYRFKLHPLESPVYNSPQLKLKKKQMMPKMNQYH